MSTQKLTSEWVIRIVLYIILYIILYSILYGIYVYVFPADLMKSRRTNSEYYHFENSRYEQLKKREILVDFRLYCKVIVKPILIGHIYFNVLDETQENDVR